MTIAAAAANGHLFWITSRAAGTAALVLSSVSVGVGLLMGGKLLRRRTADLRIAHEALSLATLLAIAVHGAALLGDGYLRPSVLDVTVPFASGYKTVWTTIGILAGWSLVLLGLSFYARARIGQARWRSLHRFTALAWALGVVHSLGEGTDAGQTWFLGMTAAVVVPALLLLARRMWPAPAPPAVAPRPVRTDALR
jgi:sulfoxide reductase heme-binding subunit YedZ